jgi:hypothetical protein
VLWNIETPDVKGDFDRLVQAGAIVVREPCAPGGAPDDLEVLVATFEDPDGNYCQLVSPM